MQDKKFFILHKKILVATIKTKRYYFFINLALHVQKLIIQSLQTKHYYNQCLRVFQIKKLVISL